MIKLITTWVEVIGRFKTVPSGKWICGVSQSVGHCEVHYYWAILLFNKVIFKWEVKRNGKQRYV